jgi:hypothetical protein
MQFTFFYLKLLLEMVMDLASAPQNRSRNVVQIWLSSSLGIALTHLRYDA